jgi:hypothetical protein
MLVATLIVIVLLFVLTGFTSGRPLAEHLAWSLIAAAFPVSLVSLILINLKGTLARRLKAILDQIQRFEGSLRAKLETEKAKPEAQQDRRRIETWMTNLDGLDQQRRDLTSKYQLEPFRGSIAFLAAVYAFGFFFAFNKVLPLAGFGALQQTLATFPDTTIAALIGAWAFALYSVIARIATADQSPQFLLRLSYQPIIAAALAYFATFMFAEDFVLLLSFGIGFLPYPELVRWTRVTTNRRLNGGKEGAATAADGGEGRLSEIDGIDFDEIDRLHEENIKNIQQLAFSNPLVAHFVTAYPLKTIIDWTDQALLRIYIDRETADKLRPLGIRGAIEMAQVRRRIREFEGRAKEAAAKGDQAKADALMRDTTDFLAAVAVAAGTNESAVRNLAYQLGEDPHIEFIYFLYDELASAA